MQLLDAYKGAAYNPVTALPYEHLWYVEGPNFVALPPSNGAAPATVPNDGVSVRALANDTASARPLYIAASNLNSQPALRWDGSNDVLINNYTGGNDWSAISQPFTIVCIWKMASVVQGTISAIFGSRGGAGSNRHDLFSNTTPTPDSFSINAGATISASSPAFDTNPHLAVVTFDATDTLELDGTQIISGDASSQTSISMCWGALQGLFLSSMDSPLLGLVKRALTSDEKAALRTWSQAKYGTA